MRHLNINHQKISRIFQLFAKIGCAAAVLTFVACNLFIEDELDWREDIPVHTGYGYDEPVTENGEFYDLTYQFNSNVNILSDNAMNYLRNVSMDSSMWIGVLDYDLNMPKELRPVRGEILFHGICDKLPEGMMHEVVCATEMEGYYKVLVCVVPFEDLFKQIDMDVDLGKGLDMQGLSDPEEPEEAEEPEESEEDTASSDEMDDNQETHPANAPRRVDVADEDLGKFHKIVNIPISYFKDIDVADEKGVKVKGGINVQPNAEDDKDNTIDFRLKGKAKLLKTEKGIDIPFGVYLDSDITYQANLDIEATMNMVATIFNKADILPSSVKVTILIGPVPVVLKICLGIDITLDMTYKVVGSIKFRLPVKAKFEGDIFDLGLGPLWATLVRGHGANFKIKPKEGYFAISQSFGNHSKFYVALTPGIGIFSSKLSTRLLVHTPYIEFKINSPKTHVGSLGYGWEIQGHEGVKFENSFSVALQAWVPSNFSTVFNEIVDEMADAQKVIGYAAAWILLQGSNAQTANDYIKSVNELNTFIKKFKGDSESHKGYFIYGTDTVSLDKKSWSNTWMPTMEEEKKPFMFRKEYEKAGIRDEDNLHIEYTINSIGILPMIQSFKPCLMISDKYYNFQKIVFSKKTIDKKLVMGPGGLTLKYDISMNDLPPETDLYAFPGFYSGSEKESYFNSKKGIPLSSKLAFWFDKQQAVNTKTPPNTHIKWIYNYENDDLSRTPGRYKKQRHFLVKWEVDDIISERATTTGIKFDKGVGDNGDLSQDVYIQQSEYVLDVSKMCEDDYDLSFFAYPYASRTDGSESGEIRVGTGTFIGNIPNGCSVIRQPDGSFKTKQGSAE